MILIFRTLLSSLPLMALPALATDDNAVATGITSVGPAMFLFTIAIALLLTLVLRSTTSHFARFLTARIGRFRIQRALTARSKDVLNNFILPGAYGGLAKIDHAMMTAGGVLCIRTVHFNGIVFGGEDEAQWTNVDGVSRRRFLNPLIQNEGRSRALRQVMPEVPIANLVIFTGSVEFTTEMPKNVIRVSELESFIAKFIFGPSKIDDWHAVWLTLNAAVLSDEASRKDFAAQISFS
ncbi:MAG: NERD domain-containing protein [Gammaproteobacteria bacterium]|nr:NERD domain-containing protein [Pseudomonadota bacterium]TDJ39000.1 MAG: NERD domain-containing protein [Gammaproteobacteria bacterium]